MPTVNPDKMISDEEFERIYRENYDGFLRYAANILKTFGSNYVSVSGRAEEAVQETFRIACTRADVLYTSPNPEGWLINTLKNVLSNMAHNRATASRIMTQYISTQIKELTVTEDRLRFELLYENVSDLEEFKLLKEMVIEGKSHLEMAEARGISVAACKKRVQRAKEVLRKNIK